MIALPNFDFVPMTWCSEEIDLQFENRPVVVVVVDGIPVRMASGRTS